MCISKLWHGACSAACTVSSDLGLPEDVSPDRRGLLACWLPAEQRGTVDRQGAGLRVAGVAAGEGRRLLGPSQYCRWLNTHTHTRKIINDGMQLVDSFKLATTRRQHRLLTWSPEEPALGWIVRPRVTPPLRAFFRLSFTSVSSSSRLTRSSSFCRQSSSTFFSRSDSEACERLPSGRREGDFSVNHFNRGLGELFSDQRLL